MPNDQSENHIDITLDDGVLAVRLNSPATRNSLTPSIREGLAQATQQAVADPDVRVVYITGTGKAFCAGHDLKEMTAGRQAEDGGKAYFKHLFDKCARTMTSIPKMPQPVIAQVHGIATAAGCQLVASCDLAVAGHS